MSDVKRRKIGKILIIVAWILLSFQIMWALVFMANWNSPSVEDLRLQSIMSRPMSDYPITVVTGVASYIIGVNTFAIVALLLGWIAQRMSKNGKVLMKISVICIVITASLLLIKQYRIHAMNQSAIKLSIEKLSSDFMKAADGALKTDENTDFKRYGQAGSLMQIVEEFWIQGQTYILKMNEEILNYNISDIFQTETLTNLTKISQLKSNILLIQNIIAKYENKVRLLTEEFQKKFEQLDYPDNLRLESLTLYRKAVEKDLEYFRIEREYLLEMERFLSFMERKQDQLTVRDNKIFFSKQEDIDAYKTHIYSLAQLADEENVWRQGVQHRNEQFLGELNSIANGF